MRRCSACAIMASVFAVNISSSYTVPAARTDPDTPSARPVQMQTNGRAAVCVWVCVGVCGCVRVAVCVCVCVHVL